MKNILLALFIGTTTIGMAQEVETVENQDAATKKHEIRLDALEALAVPAIELNYEYIISRYSGVGAAISINLDDEFYDYQKFAFTPFYRQYFFNKKDFGARGLFAEGMLQLASGEEREFFFNDNGVEIITQEDWTNFGIGFALGQKWVSKNGFILEISIGAGRYLGSDDFAPEGFIRGGVLVGYRF